MRRIAVLIALLGSLGCSITPFTSEGVGRAIESLSPLMRELAQGQEGSDPTDGTRNVTVVVIFPNIARSIWPFSEVRVGWTSERYVIVLPQSDGSVGAEKGVCTERGRGEEP